jgi:hypothetical protein
MAATLSFLVKNPFWSKSKACQLSLKRYRGDNVFNQVHGEVTEK